jgi:hypothetical protein
MNKQSGVSSLIAVLFGMAILSAIMVSIFTYTLVLTKQATRFNTSETVYHAAESAIFETASRIKYYPADIAALNQPYMLGHSEITRTVTLTGGMYEIEIIAQLRGMERTMKATYTPGVSLTYDDMP